MNLGGVNYLWQKSEKTLHKNLYHVWKKVKAVKINVYFSGEKILSCEKLNMKKKSRKNVLNHDWINWKKHFQEKIMEKPSGKKRYQGRNCFYHVWKKWKNVRGVHKSWVWKTENISRKKCIPKEKKFIMWETKYKIF